MIRTFSAYFLVLFFFITTIPVLMILWVIGKINMHVHDILSYGIMHWAFSVILKVSGARVTVLGYENILKDTPVLYAGNHRSFFDIIIAYRYVSWPTGFISKKEWDRIPVLSHWISTLHGLFLDRDNLKEGLKTILKAIEHVKNDGISYVIYPEGTRSHNEEMLPFKEGSMKIATKSGCPIIPMATIGSDELLEKHMPYVKSADVAIIFGKPIYPDKLSKDELKFLGAHVRDIIQQMIDEYKNRST